MTLMSVVGIFEPTLLILVALGLVQGFHEYFLSLVYLEDKLLLVFLKYIYELLHI